MNYIEFETVFASPRDKHCQGRNFEKYKLISYLMKSKNLLNQLYIRLYLHTYHPLKHELLSNIFWFHARGYMESDAQVFPLFEIVFLNSDKNNFTKKE